MSLLLADFWLPSTADLLQLSPELALVATVVVMLTAATLLGRQLGVASGIAIVGTLAALLGCGFAAFALPGGELLRSGSSPGLLLADAVSLSFRALLLAALVVVIGLWRSVERPAARDATEFLTLLLCSAIGMALMTSSANLLLLVLAIEVASQSSYALVGAAPGRRGAEAALKYVLVGAASTGIALYGVSLLFALCGTMDVAALAQRLPLLDGGPREVAHFALLAVFMTIAFKLAAVPVHTWCPDVFEGAPLSVAAWLSVASKGAAVVMLVRLTQAVAAADPAGALTSGVQVVLGVVAVATMTLGNLAALRQQSVRRMLAYSAIAHAGYLLCATAALQPGVVSSSAASAVIGYLVVYFAMNLGAFAVLGAVARSRGSEQFSAFTGLGSSRPLLAVSMTICLASLIGLPPLGGFIVKWWVIYALADVAAGAPWLWLLVAAVVLNTVLSVTYYARLMREMFRGAPADGAGLHAPQLRWLSAGVAAAALFLVLTGTLLAPLLKQSADAVARGMMKLPASPGYAGGM